MYLLIVNSTGKCTGSLAWACVGIFKMGERNVMDGYELQTCCNKMKITNDEETKLHVCGPHQGMRAMQTHYTFHPFGTQMDILLEGQDERLSTLPVRHLIRFLFSLKSLSIMFLHKSFLIIFFVRRFAIECNKKCFSSTEWTAKICGCLCFLAGNNSVRNPLPYLYPRTIRNAMRYL